MYIKVFFNRDVTFIWFNPNTIYANLHPNANDSEQIKLFNGRYDDMMAHLTHELFLQFLLLRILPLTVTVAPGAHTHTHTHTQKHKYIMRTERHTRAVQFIEF